MESVRAAPETDLDWDPDLVLDLDSVRDSELDRETAAESAEADHKPGMAIDPVPANLFLYQ